MGISGTGCVSRYAAMNAAFDAAYFALCAARFLSRSAFCSGVSFGAFLAAFRNLSRARCPSLFLGIIGCWFDSIALVGVTASCKIVIEKVSQFFFIIS